MHPAQVKNIESIDSRLWLLKQFGSRPIQYSTLQDGLEYYFLRAEENGNPHQALTGLMSAKGYVAFKRKGRLFSDVIVLGDPVVAARDMELLLDRFLAEVPRACFWQLSHKTARLLHKKGYYVNQCGIETSLRIKDYNLGGTGKQNLRTAVHKAVKSGVRLEEQNITEVDPEELHRVSGEWMQRKIVSSAEMSFLARPALLRLKEPYVRKFFAYRAGRLLGFVFFNPLFDHNRVTGYTVDISRTSHDSPKGLSYYMVLAAMHIIRQDRDIDTISLGWSPLYKIEDNESFNSAFTTIFFTSQFQAANRVYNYKGIAKNKAEYRGEEEPVYFASRYRVPLRQIYRTYRACNINPLLQTVKALTA